MKLSDAHTSLVQTQLLSELPVVKNATTSRVVVNNEYLRYVLFSFDTGQLLTEHSSSRAVIVNLLSGSMNFELGGVVHKLEAGDIVYLAPGDKHALEALTPCHLALTMVDIKAVEQK